MVQLMIKGEAWEQCRAPPSFAVLPVMTLFRIVGVELLQNIPPPFAFAVLPLKVQPVTCGDELTSQKIPPPFSFAEFPLMVQPEMVGEE